MFEDDYILRMVKQLGAAIARIARLNEQAAHDEALAAADQAWSDLLGIPPELAASIDSATLAGMLRDPGKIRLAARLLYEQARALAAQGDPTRAQLRYRRAMELLLEARALDPSELAADAAAIEALRPLVPLDALAPRHRALAATRDAAVGEHAD